MPGLHQATRWTTNQEGAVETMTVNPEEDIVIRGCFGGWGGPPDTVDLSKMPSVESADYGKPPVGSTPGDPEFRSWFDSMMGRCRATLYQGENYVPGSVQWGCPLQWNSVVLTSVGELVLVYW